MPDSGPRHFRLLRNAFGVTVAGVLLLACGDTVTQIAVDDVVELRISPASAQLVIGRTLRFQALPLDEKGALLSGLDVTWTSTDPAVATVDGVGLVTGLSEGTTEIVASLGGLTARAHLEVAPGPQLVLSDDSVHFDAVAGEAAPPPTSVDITNGGSLDLAGLAIDSITYGPGASGWLAGQLAASMAPTTLELSVMVAGVTGAGTYLATVWLSAVDAEGSPAPVRATLSISASAPASLTIHEGDGQTAPAGTAVALAPAVRVVDPFGNSVGGIEVTFSVTGGGGSLTEPTTTTDAAGVARVGSWTLGTQAGANTMSAAAAGLTPVIVSATAEPSSASTLEIGAGEGQAAVAGSVVPIPPAVITRDEFGNPVEGVVVSYEVSSGGGSVTGGTATSDADGVATAGSWTLGPTVGANTLVATAAGVEGSVVFTATGLTGAAAVIQLESGDAQTDSVAATLATPYAVRVTDENGNPVGGVTVTWAVTAGGGSIGTLSSTDASGEATGTHTFGTSVGAQTAAASVTGLSGSPVAFSSTAVAGAPTSVVEAGGNGQTATVGTDVATGPSVLVADQFENPVAEAEVVFEVTGGGGSVAGAASSTDANGIAQVGAWTLGQAAGANALSATVAGLPPVIFDATGLAGTATELQVDGGDGQSAVAGAAVAVAPSVAALDEFGNPVEGVQVQFTVASGGGSVTGASPTTGPNGVAAVGSWTLGAVAGPNSLTATAVGIQNSVTFNATGIGGMAVAMALQGGDAQADTVAATLMTAYSVRVVDAGMNGVPGVTVSWTVTGGGGSITPSSVTGLDGVATATRVLGTATGTHTATASVGGLAGSPVAFEATASAGAPALGSVAGGDGQSATVNTAVATPPSVSVTDQFGNPTGGVGVTFAVDGGGGSVTGAVQVTNGAGVATVGSWTLGTVAGANGLSATPTGLGAVAFSATGTADVPSQLLLHAGDGQEATAGTPVATEPAVKVLDQFDNPVQGATVTFEVVTGGGSVTGETPSSGTDGVATVGSWTLGGPVGANTLRASVGGVPGMVTFNATGLVGPAASVSLNGGNAQVDTVAATLGTAYSVLVADANGNPVSGTTVSWSVIGGGGSITPNSDTNGSGIASATRVLGTGAGIQTANASVGGLAGSPVSFTATATAGAATQITATAGNGQSQTVNVAVSVDPRVRVDDQFGNPVPGHSVTFAVTGGGGSVNPSTAVLTAANGTAAVTSWTLGTTAGTNNNTLTATAAGGGIAGNPVGFTASATAGAAASITVQANNGQTAISGVNVSNPPTALVEDQFGNAVSGATVDFSASGGGSVGSGSVGTNASGLASTTWEVSTTGHAMGTDGRYSNTLTATVQGTAHSTNFSGFAIFSFQTHVNPLWAQQGCTGCHGGTSGLFLNSTAAANYDELDSPAVCNGGALPASRVVSTAGGVLAADSSSVLMRMVDTGLPLAPGCTSSAASMTMPAAQVEIIRAWIRNGAPEN